MAVLNVQMGTVGLAGVQPRVVYIDTNDTLAAVTTAGYLNKLVQQGYKFSESDMCCVSTRATPSAIVIAVAWLEVSFVAPNWSLVPTGSPGQVVLPTVANRLVHATNATGMLSTDAANVTNAGNISAGLSGTAGFLASFPGTAARGSLRLVGANSAGDTVTQITNASQGGARVYTIPDGGVAASNFLLTDSAGTQTIATGNLTLTLGNITAAAGNIAATLGSLAAGTTVTAGTGVTATTGNITATAGNLVAGSSGAVGFVQSFPTTAANGSLILAAVNAGGAFNTVIANGTMGQSAVYTIPDIGNSVGRFLVAATATPFTAGHSVMASGTGGLVVDAGYQMKTVAGAAAAGGNADQTFVDAFCTAASNVVGNWNTQANAASVLKIVPGVGSFVVTSTADAGVGTFNYIITKTT